MNRVKVFTDATTKNEKSGIGYIIEDERGNILSEVIKVINEWKITQAELKAIHEAIHEAKKYAEEIIVYTDSYSIVQMYKENAHPNKDDMQGLIWYLKQLSKNVSLELRYIPSEKNIADSIAKQAFHPYHL